MKKHLLGVLVCGGQSKRMGKDKGLLLINGQTWAAHVAEKIHASGIPVMISVNAGQQEAYARIFGPEKLIVDQFNIGGPMNGLLTAHAVFPDKDIFFMACDMIEMEERIIHDALAAYEKNKGYDFYAYEVEDVLQPFCSIYTAGVLKQMLQKLEQQTLASSSMRYTLENGNTFKMVASHSAPFVNYNTLDERNDSSGKTGNQ